MDVDVCVEEGESASASPARESEKRGDGRGTDCPAKGPSWSAMLRALRSRTASAHAHARSEGDERDALGLVLALDDPADLVHALEQVGHLVGGEVAEPGGDASRDDEDICVVRAGRVSLGDDEASPHLVGSRRGRGRRGGERRTARDEGLEVDDAGRESALVEDLVRDPERGEAERRESGHSGLRGGGDSQLEAGENERGTGRTVL